LRLWQSALLHVIHAATSFIFIKALLSAPTMNLPFSIAQAQQILARRGNERSASDQQAADIEAFQREMALRQMQNNHNTSTAAAAAATAEVHNNAAGDNSDDESEDSEDSAANAFGNNDNDTTYHLDDDAFENDYAAENYSFHDRVIYFLGGNSINSTSRKSVEITMLIEAGTIVTDEPTTDVKHRAQMMHEKYVELVEKFPPNNFNPPELKTLMKTKLYQSKQPLNGERLWTKFNDYRSEIRSTYMPKLPNELSTMPSGYQLRDVYNSFELARYKEVNVSTFAASTSVYISYSLT
jgi:hypothetical protein